MYTVGTRELVYDCVVKKPLFICAERKFDSGNDATTYVRKFRQRAEPGERATAYKRIGNTDYRLL